MTTALINLTDYPLDQPDSSHYQSLVAQQRSLLAANGMINLPDFLTPAGVATCRQEIEARADIAYHAISERHPYGYHTDASYPASHPLNRLSKTQSFRLAHHHLPDTQIDTLYRWEPLRQFIAAVTGNEEIFLSGDPSNAVVVQVYREGCGQAWHFDQALFSTILNVAESTAGGVFECVPGIRSEDDPSYAEVQKVLDKQSDRIQKHSVKAGSFTIMLGRYTMHRVTEIEQQRPRISIVLSYEQQPGVYMDLETRKTSFGPTAPELPA